jgi:hypothetical protein
MATDRADGDVDVVVVDVDVELMSGDGGEGVRGACRGGGRVNGNADGGLAARWWRWG